MMPFDFSNLATDPPSGCLVIQADRECLKLKHKASGRVFHIEKQGEHDFALYVRSVVDSPSNPRGQFVMRSDFKRLMYLVGYGKNSTGRA